MKPKIKIIIKYPLIKWRAFRARRLAKRCARPENEERYDLDFRHNYVLKQVKKFAKTLNVQVEVSGLENVPKKTALITPNHSSSFDPGIVLMALEDPERGPDKVKHRSVFLAKKSIEKNKRVNGYAKIINTFFIDRKKPREALKTMDEMIKHSKKESKHIIIFPEGTRSKNGEIADFKSGAFRVAKKSYLPIVPVTINNALSISDLNRKGKLKVQVIFHKPIKPITFMDIENKSLGQRIEKIVKAAWKKPEGKRSSNEDEVA